MHPASTDDSQLIRLLLESLRLQTNDAAWVALQMFARPYTTVRIESGLVNSDGTLVDEKTLVIRCAPDTLDILRDQVVQAAIESAWDRICTDRQIQYDVHPYYLINPDSLLPHILRRKIDD